MRIEGIHVPTNTKVFIMKNTTGLFDLYCYDSDGAVFFEGSFRSIDRAKFIARHKYGFSGRWKWEMKIKLKAVQIEGD